MLFIKNFVAVALINLFVMLAYYLLFVICSPYAIERFAASPSVGGLVAGLMLIGCLAGRFFTGRIAGSVGFKKVLLIGLVLYTGSMALYPVAGNLAFLMVIRFISGLGIGCIGTVTGTMIVHIVPQHLHGAGINYFSLSTIMAMALGPFLGIFLMQFVSFIQLFWMCTILGGIGLVLACVLSCPENECEPDGAEKPSAFSLQEYIAHEAVPLAWVVLIVSLGHGCTQAFLSFYAREIDLVDSASLFFLLYAATAFCLRPFAGKLFDRRGANIIAYPSLFVMACAFLVLSQAQAPWMVLLAGALMGIGMGNFQTTSQAACIKLVPKRRFAQATSTFFIFLDFGIGMGPYLLGFLVPAIGYRGLFLTAAAFTFLCLPLYYRAHGRFQTAANS